MDTPYDLAALPHRNILVIDDLPTVHLTFETCLRPDDGEIEHSRNHDGDVIVDTKKALYNFNVHCVLSGEDGLSLAKQLALRKTPIQTVFVNMRMDGWDGIETIQRLIDFDQRMSFVITTEFPDDTRQQVEERLGAAPLQIFPKPVDLERVYQTAFQMASRWNRLHADY